MALAKEQWGADNDNQNWKAPKKPELRVVKNAPEVDKSKLKLSEGAEDWNKDKKRTKKEIQNELGPRPNNFLRHNQSREERLAHEERLALLKEIRSPKKEKSPQDLASDILEQAQISIDDKRYLLHGGVLKDIVSAAIENSTGNFQNDLRQAIGERITYIDNRLKDFKPRGLAKLAFWRGKDVASQELTKEKRSLMELFEAVLNVSLSTPR
ncbi:MAG TPA: hypothetical protein VJH75_02445 [Patescibacteria group bacterium]|nr:hypothetical protein [Patescibacteria group bacterium]